MHLPAVKLPDFGGVDKLALLSQTMGPKLHDTGNGCFSELTREPRVPNHCPAASWVSFLKVQSVYTHSHMIARVLLDVRCPVQRMGLAVSSCSHLDVWL